jgi:hypothetical protein
VSNDEERERFADSEHVLRVRLGHGANCSSLGSVVDTLFATAAVGAAMFAAVVAALATEPVKMAEVRENQSDADERERRPP